MRTFRVSVEPGILRLRRDADFKACVLLAIVEVFLFLVYRVIPFQLLLGMLLLFTTAFLGVLWPRIVSEEIFLSRRSFTYRRGLWPLVVSTELEWRNLDPPRVVNAGVRGWRGPIGFNDARSGKTYRVGAGLQPADCRKILDSVEQFRKTIS